MIITFDILHFENLIFAHTFNVALNWHGDEMQNALKDVCEEHINFQAIKLQNFLQHHYYYCTYQIGCI